MKGLWLTNRNEPFHRYLLHPHDCEKLYNGDGDYTTAFSLRKYWGEDGDWKPFEGGWILVDIKTLLSEFVLVDSPTDKYIKGLEELRDNNFRKNQESSISLFTDAFASIQQTEQEDNPDQLTETDETD